MALHRSRQIVLTGVTVLVLAMSLGITACQTSQASSPTAVVEGFIAAQNAGDVEASLAFLADDAVIQLVPPPLPGDDGVFMGQEEIRGWYENTAGNHGNSKLSKVQVNGEVVTARLTYSDAGLRQMGLDSVENDWTVTVKNGLIQGYTAAMTEESFQKLMAALAAAAQE